MRLPLLLVTSLSLLGSVWNYPYGAPDNPAVCASMKPGHTQAPMRTAAPFEIRMSRDVYYDSDTVEVTIRATSPTTFKGFLIQARRADYRLNQNEPIGFFTRIDGTKITCAGFVGNGLTHTSGVPGSEQPKTELVLTWTAPGRSQGHLEFRISLVSNYDTYWVAERSAVLKDPYAATLPDSVVTYEPGTQQPIATIDTEGCGEVKGCYRNPPGCAEASCTGLVTWVDAGDFVDFELSASTDGWVAVAFSEDKKMGRDSVVECFWNAKDSIVEARSSYNADSGKYNTVLEPPGIGLSNVEGFFSSVDGHHRVRCRFRRQKIVSDYDTIFDLGPKYYMLVADGELSPDGVKMRHLLDPFKDPMVSKRKVSVTDIVDLNGTARYPLVKLHGCLMIIAWMMSASTAILLARYYKKMWPNSRWCRERVWFAVHRGCMITALFCVIIGFIVIWIHTGGYSQMPDLPARAHPILGIVVTILVILNPLIAACRPSTKARHRPIFNWFHWLFGTCGHVLATPTLFIGLSLPKAHVPWWATWVMVAFMLFHLIIELMLEIHGCLNSRKQKLVEEEFELRKASEHGAKFYGHEPEPVGHHFKKRVITIYLCVMFILGLVMILAIAIG